MHYAASELRAVVSSMKVIELDQFRSRSNKGNRDGCARSQGKHNVRKEIVAEVICVTRTCPHPGVENQRLTQSLQLWAVIQPLRSCLPTCDP